jgi:hypothetical protein
MTINQFIAPRGYREFVAGVCYHRLRWDKRRGIVFFASFSSRPPRAHLTALSSAAYESGLAQRLITTPQSAGYMPPWLSSLEGLDLDLVNGERHKPVRGYRDMVEQRLAVLQPLMENIDGIFSSDDPTKEINRYARLAKPSQNETRVRTWFLTYLAFGQNIWVLMPPHRENNGTWARLEKPETKFGRPPKTGSHHGHPVNDKMIEDIKVGYLTNVGEGVPLSKIYALSMTNVFNCRSEKREDGSTQYVHPEGKPFPSRHQFRYWCKKAFGIETIQRGIYGEQRFRNRLQASRGRYSQAVANVMEKVEADAYWVLERPRGFTAEHVMPGLCVVVLVCVATNMKVGIGFSLGSEEGAAYRAALFCAAIGKKKFGSLFGIVISDDEWPGEGLPANFIPDRGPGSSAAVVSSLAGKTPLFELPPSYTPQSHATVEASHPRDVKLSGPPSFVQSRLNAVELARREILNLIGHNRSASAVDRMTIEMVADKVLPTPLEMWKYLDARGRSDAQPISFDDAVRAFLTPVEFDVEDGRLSLKKLFYNSPALRDTGAMDKLKKVPACKLKGYALEMCVRRAWVVINNRLVEVDAQLPLRDDGQQLHVSLTELEPFAAGLLEGRRRVEENCGPVQSEIINRVKSAIGKDGYADRLKPGRPKARTPKARREVKDIKHGTGSAA